MKKKWFLISGVGASLTLITAIACPISFLFMSNYSKKQKNKFFIQTSLSNKSLLDKEHFLSDFKEELSGFKFKIRRSRNINAVKRKSTNRTNQITLLRKPSEKHNQAIANSPISAKFTSTPTYEES